MADNIFDEIQQYTTEAKAIEHYVPAPDIEEIGVVQGLKKLLAAKSEFNAFSAVAVETNGYFQRAIGHTQNRLYDPEKLKGLIKKYSVEAIKQKQMSAEALLQQMQQYADLTHKLLTDYAKTDQNLQVLDTMLGNPLKKSETNQKLADRFDEARRRMNDQYFSELTAQQQQQAIKDTIGKSYND